MVVLTYTSLSTLMGVISRVVHIPPTRWVNLCQHPFWGSLVSSSSGKSSALTWLRGLEGLVSDSVHAVALAGLLLAG